MRRREDEVGDFTDRVAGIDSTALVDQRDALGWDFDALDYAREQLRAVIAEVAGTELPLALRVQLGLLAAQVAVAERLSGPPAHARADGSVVGRDAGSVRVLAWNNSYLEWNVELTVRVLARTAPRGIDLIRAMIGEGGRVSADRVRELTGLKSLATMTRAIHTANVIVAGEEFRCSDLVRCRRAGPGPASRAEEYFFPPGVLALVTTALQQLDDNG
ncbi:hypothetical protein [Nocardia cyriacigeorgica]|uniref:hypothetical protein n=1 Tax=Nocardia cyriacigeorgica TaxID=135487 RepID=UPI0018961F8A|nr:hypothetical protein [Nocardia cyriacigeorgica]MBF6289863.1 hypothetical protein [Nocardia cyriacigeorgica]